MSSLATRISPPGPMSGAMKVYSPRGMFGSPVNLMASMRPRYIASGSDVRPPPLPDDEEKEGEEDEEDEEDEGVAEGDAGESSMSYSAAKSAACSVATLSSRSSAVANMYSSSVSSFSDEEEEDVVDAASVGAVLQLPALLTLPPRSRDRIAHSARSGSARGLSGCVTSRNSQPWPA